MKRKWVLTFLIIGIFSFFSVRVSALTERELSTYSFPTPYTHIYNTSDYYYSKYNFSSGHLALSYNTNSTTSGVIEEEVVTGGYSFKSNKYYKLWITHSNIYYNFDDFFGRTSDDYNTNVYITNTNNTAISCRVIYVRTKHRDTGAKMHYISFIFKCPQNTDSITIKLRNSTDGIFSVGLNTDVNIKWTDLEVSSIDESLVDEVDDQFIDNTDIIVDQNETIINQNEQIINGQDNINDSITDDNVDDNLGSSFFSGFDTEDNGGISSIITSPLTAINSLLNYSNVNSCTDLSINFTLKGKETTFTLPCGKLFWSKVNASMTSTIQILVYGLCTYAILKRLFKDIEALKNPNNDRVDVMDLW